MSRTTAKKWSPARYELGAARAKAPIDYLKPSKKTRDVIDTAAEIVVAGSLSTLAFTAIAPQCVFRGYPYAGNPEAALAASLLVDGLYWGFTGDGVGSVAAIGTTALLYGICKIF